MKVKTKLIMSIMSICLVCAVFAIGVFALKTANLKIGGDVSFQATGVEAHIKNASVSGTVTPTTLAANDAEGEVINTSMTQSDINTTFANWSDIKLDFDESATDIELKFQIANTSTNADNYIEIDYSYSFSNSSPNVDVFPGDENDQSVWENNEYILTPKGSAANATYETFTLKFKVLDKELNVPQDTKVSVNIELKHVTPQLLVQEDIFYWGPNKTLRYELDKSVTPYSASVMPPNVSDSTEITIYPVVTDGTDNYITTSVYCGQISNITTIELPNSVRHLSFSENTSIQTLEIPKSVTSLENNAFESCNALTQITIPNTVTSIGESAFKSCTNLTSITIPSGVTSISKNTFNSCTKLTEIVIPSNVTTIGEGAFYYCLGLTSITIPSSVTSIGPCAFMCDITTAKFENPIGWFKAASADATEGTAVTVTSDFTGANATLLRSIGENQYLLRK